MVPQDTPRISIGQGVQMEHTGQSAVHDILWLLQTVPLDLACLVVRPDIVILELECGGSGLSYDATRARFLSFRVFFFLYSRKRNTVYILLCHFQMFGRGFAVQGFLSCVVNAWCWQQSYG